MFLTRLATGVLIFAAQALTSRADVRYRAVSVGPFFPNDIGSYIYDLNNENQLCGVATIDLGGGFAESKGFVWDMQSGAHELVFFEYKGIPLSINDAGEAAGVGNTDIGDLSAYWDAEGNPTSLGTFPGARFPDGDAKGINNLGQVTGFGFGSDGWQRMYFWDSAHGMMNLGELPGGQITSIAYAINDNGWVTGWSTDQYGYHGVIWNAEQGLFSIGGIGLPYGSSDPYKINNLNQAVGIASSATHGMEAFRWTPEEGMIGLGVLHNGWYSEATDINDRGQIVGHSWNPACYPPGPNCGAWYLWDPEHGMREFSALLDPCMTNRFGGPTFINNRGVMFGSAGLYFPYIPGDLNEDGVVDLGDLAVMLTNFGRVGDAQYADGDLNCDHAVDLSDLGWLLGNYGQSLP